MMTQKQSARKFVEYWTFQRGSEKGEDQQFWNSLLGEVLGLEDVKSHVQYQVPVPMKGTTKFLDAWIPETRVLIEHKSRGVNLDAPQAGHNGLTPYEQAAEYDAARSFDEKARWIVTCNFDEFRIYDRAKPLAPPLTLKLANLPKEAYRLNFLVNPKEKAIDRELEISVQAGRIVGELYDAFLRQYGNSDATTLAALNRLCVRLVFCLYAEDAEIFPKDCFRRLVEASDERRLRSDLQRLFITLDTPLEKRDAYLEKEFQVFPYTNGGLFRDAAETDIPPLTEDIRKLLIGATQFDWREITPTIFGALFESTLNPITRRAGGMVYTSVENIHKVIDPLFLSELTRRVNETTSLPPSPSTQKKLKELQTEIASLKFLDPASGSGNFLTETFICLRRLENKIISALQQGQREFDLGTTVKVSISQFHGIEINDFAVSVAKTALWIAEAQMLLETADILHREPDYLPLKDYDGIIEGNALRMDWPHTNYIMGNPPFVGARMMSQGSEQKKDIEDLFGNIKDVQDLDYVCGWYKKAVVMGAKCAFVSTNSICQGAQVPILWGDLIGKHGVTIDFAHQTFRWDNESTEKAAVHCVIVGFHAQGITGEGNKILFSPSPTIVDNISPYLTPGQSMFVIAAKHAAAGLPKMNFGNQPRDGGHFVLTPEERDAILAAEPQIVRWIRPYIGAEEFIKGKMRYCIWLKGASPADIAHSKTLYARVAAVREFRLASKAKTTNGYANVPHLFAQITQPDGMKFLLVPCVSSERRRYIPIGYMGAEVIASNAVQILPNATLYHFGVLTSTVHMAWMRTVAGRLKSDYRYSKELVYNTFPWPDVEEFSRVEGESAENVLDRINKIDRIGDDENPDNPVNPVKKTLHVSTRSTRLNNSVCSVSSVVKNITQTAQSILDARALYPDSSLADLYDPLTMPPELRKAHAANDAAVMKAYGYAPTMTEPEIVANLMHRYQELTESCQCRTV